MEALVGQRRHKDLELDGNWSKVTTLLLVSWSVGVFVFLLLLFADITKSEQHQCSGNVTD